MRIASTSYGGNSDNQPLTGNIKMNFCLKYSVGVVYHCPAVDLCAGLKIDHEFHGEFIIKSVINTNEQFSPITVETTDGRTLVFSEHECMDSYGLPLIHEGQKYFVFTSSPAYGIRRNRTMVIADINGNDIEGRFYSVEFFYNNRFERSLRLPESTLIHMILTSQIHHISTCN